MPTPPPSRRLFPFSRSRVHLEQEQGRARPQLELDGAETAPWRGVRAEAYRVMALLEEHSGDEMWMVTLQDACAGKAIIHLELLNPERETQQKRGLAILAKVAAMVAP